MLKNAGMKILSLLPTVMLLKSRKHMDSKNTAIHNIQQSEILAEVFQAAFTGATWYDGMAWYQWAFRTKAAAMWLNTSKYHQKELNSDSLHTWFQTNFWLFHFRNVTLFKTPTFGHSIACEVRTCDLRKDVPESTFLKNELETRGKDKGHLNSVGREERLGRSRWAHRESNELGTSSLWLSRDGH